MESVDAPTPLFHPSLSTTSTIPSPHPATSVLFHHQEIHMQPSASVSVFRATINQLNAQKSSGPRTQAGKQRSSRNALRHGLTARTAVLDSEDPEAYHRTWPLWVSTAHASPASSKKHSSTSAPSNMSAANTKNASSKMPPHSSNSIDRKS